MSDNTNRIGRRQEVFSGLCLLPYTARFTHSRQEHEHIELFCLTGQVGIGRSKVILRIAPVQGDLSCLRVASLTERNDER